MSRRKFIGQTASGLALLTSSPVVLANAITSSDFDSKPWLELSKSAYLHNATQISQMAGGKPVIAVLKNNAYGLGVIEVSKILDQSPHIYEMAVVKDQAAIEMKQAGVRKPILLMGDFDSELFFDLVERNVTLSIYSRNSLEKIREMSRNLKHPVDVALYLDTGLGRMGIPYEDAAELASDIHQ
ncbi:MAG: alanine racemase [Ekhidna sp.]|nr:alanine racemase [Ekhidna sp.]